MTTAKSQPRILIAAGGTGGHIAPALAVGACLRRKHNAEVLYVCGNRPAERALYTDSGEAPVALSLSGVPSLRPVALRPWMDFGRALLEARQLVRQFRPNAVLAMGGYACVPVLLAARQQRIPFALHDSNAVPGRVTRRFARSATRVFLGFRSAANVLDPRATVELTGTPVRESLLKVSRLEAERRFGLKHEAPTLLVIGGSQGARGLNQALIEALPILCQSFSAFRPLQILWSAGAGNLVEVDRAAERFAEDLRLDVHLFGSIVEMGHAYAAADLVLSRAGASTLAEVTAVGRASLLVPYPHAADDHQTANAKDLVDAGGAELLPENRLTGALLAERILDNLMDHDLRRERAEAARSTGNRHAARTIAESLLAMLPRQEAATTPRATPVLEGMLS